MQATLQIFLSANFLYILSNIDNVSFIITFNVIFFENDYGFKANQTWCLITGFNHEILILLFVFQWVLAGSKMSFKRSCALFYFTTVSLLSPSLGRLTYSHPASLFIVPILPFRTEGNSQELSEPTMLFTNANLHYLLAIKGSTTIYFGV